MSTISKEPSFFDRSASVDGLSLSTWTRWPTAKPSLDQLPDERVMVSASPLSAKVIVGVPSTTTCSKRSTGTGAWLMLTSGPISKSALALSRTTAPPVTEMSVIVDRSSTSSPTALLCDRASVFPLSTIAVATKVRRLIESLLIESCSTLTTCPALKLSPVQVLTSRLIVSGTNTVTPAVSVSSVRLSVIDTVSVNPSPETLWTLYVPSLEVEPTTEISWPVLKPSVVKLPVDRAIVSAMPALVKVSSGSPSRVGAAPVTLAPDLSSVFRSMSPRSVTMPEASSTCTTRNEPLFSDVPATVNRWLVRKPSSVQVCSVPPVGRVIWLREMSTPTLVSLVTSSSAIRVISSPATESIV